MSKILPYELKTIRKGGSVVPYLRDECDVKPDLIILDLGLPEMSGFEILAELSEGSYAEIGHIPIVILTNIEDFEYICQSYPRLHICDYLTKPCSTDDVERLLLRTFSERKWLRLE